MTEPFDPLAGAEAAFLQAAIKQRVRNIIRSYNHPADILAEPTQNSVDEVDEAVRSGAVDRGRIVVGIDCSNAKVSVEDNGRGISVENVKRLLAPDMTEKATLFKNGLSRGHKGVGLTFLAYGFNYFELESRTTQEHYRVRIENARQWVEDPDLDVPPIAALTRLGPDEGRLRETGTVLTIQVSDQTEPRNLARTFPSRDYSRTVLETQTAIGVYPKGSTLGSSSFDAQLDWRSSDGALSSCELKTTYRFPHLGLSKGPKVIDVGAYLASSPGVEPPLRLRKKHQAAYRFYGTDKLVTMVPDVVGVGDLLTDRAAVEVLLRKHSVTAYALAGYSAAYKDTLSKSWTVPMNRRLIGPSIRVATDGMISSWQRDLSLSHRGFNVERIWLIVHLNGVEPDLGRKDYPPQILELLNVLENPLADDIAREGAAFLIPTTRSGKSIDYEDPKVKATARKSDPLSVQTAEGLPTLRYLSEPREEQDVVALFNEMRGASILGHFRPVFFSGSYVYDSYLTYTPEEVAEEIRELLPASDGALPGRSLEGVAEFKYDLGEMLPDLVRELKTWSEIRWLVCWSASKATYTQGGLTVEVTTVRPEDSEYVGVTHIATLSTAGEAVVHVISLKSLIQALGERED
ncbi:ATP-binding protein [Blastococcus saxobsidens]|uniref:Histidine kinase/DNA gyrase B/HSP90-like ATPase n=1 Tax=Blastococcus saxobsidens TaxID=138336 RepID=A0A4Q7Y8Y1_9ACTN|nr:ATP-binding protein [Blastococcus saxobsidens]RZU32485.1 histidine kinase/DNA gyrase B/HSP90-like ATPase [Blastococcus saxobsidens]